MIFDICTVAALSKASSVMKIDMVKPIPAKNPVPMMWRQLIESGNLEMPNATAIQVINTTPIGLPSNRPLIIPKLLSEPSPLNQLPDKMIPVLAKAKIGMMMNATGLCRACCK